MGTRFKINHKEYEWEDPCCTYETIVRLAGESPGASVVYAGRKRGDVQRSGILAGGEAIDAEDGMHFQVISTGNA